MKDVIVMFAKYILNQVNYVNPSFKICLKPNLNKSWNFLSLLLLSIWGKMMHVCERISIQERHEEGARGS